MEFLTATDIKSMLAEGENANVEFKECGKTCPKDVWPTYSAFANTHGGWIILGVQEHREKRLPEKFEIVGINDINKIKEEIGSQLDNPEKVSRNLLTDDDLYEVKVDGKSVLVMRVPEADYRQKPVYLHKNKFAHSYKRTFEGDAHLTDEDLGMMVRDAFSGDNDFTIMEHYDMRHVDQETLRKYRVAFNLKNVGHVFSDLEDKDFLIQLGGYAIDEVSGKEGLTMAGVLMFGKGLVVRNLFPNLRMDYLDLCNVPEGSPLKWNERLTYDGRWENNLYNFITYVMGRITFGIPVPGVVKGTIREDDNPVTQAIRESVTNSVIHSDFKIEGVLRIEKRTDAIELRNPGVLKLSREKIYKGKHSRARNPKIQDMLRMIGFGDNIGSGFPLILRAWKEESWVRPDLVEDRDIHEVSLKLKMSSIYAPDVIQLIKDLYGESFNELSADEKECLALIVCERGQTNSELQAETGKNGWELNRLLSGLTTKEFLISHPNGRWTTYEPNTEFADKFADKFADSQINSQTNSQTADLLSRIEKTTSITELQRLILKAMIEKPSASLEELAEYLNIKPNAVRYQREKMKPVVNTVHIGANQKGSWKITFIK